MDDLNRLLRRLHHEPQPPSAEALQRAHDAVSSLERGERLPQTSRRSPHIRLGLVVAMGTATAIAASALLLLAPWQDGPGALTAAQAALVLEHTHAAISPRPGWIFHERELVTYISQTKPRRATTTTNEVWAQSGTPFRQRYLTTTPTASIELGRSNQRGRGDIYDRRTNTLYSGQTIDSRAITTFHDPATQFHQQLMAETVTLPSRSGPRKGHWQVRGKTKIDGRSVYEITLVMAPPVGFTGLTYYVDATTYVPVRIQMPATPLQTAMRRGHAETPASQTMTDIRIVTYEYLPPTPANLSLTDLQTQHPEAKPAPMGAIPPRLQAKLQLLTS